MIAKILARGQTRDEALARLRRALTDVRAVVAGGMTNKGFLLDVLGDPEFRRGGVETSWLDRSALAAGPAPTIDAALAAALQIYQRERAEVRFNFYAEASRGRPQNILPSNGREIDVVFAGSSLPLHDLRDGDRDLNCVFPLDRLRQLVAAGEIAELAPRLWGGFMGRIYRRRAVLEKEAPALARELARDGVDLFLLVPA